MRAAVVVLGDLARSTRMLAHARSLRREGWEVELVGYRETALPSDLRQDGRVRVWTVEPGARGGAPGAAAAAALAFRGTGLAADLATLLARRISRPDVILLQAPPGIPTLPATLLAGRLRRSRVVVDWHNLGWEMLGLRLGPDHALVRLLRGSEPALARRADGHLCVSRCMADVLRGLGVPGATVLHDRPDARFRRLAAAAPGRPRTDATVLVCPMGWTDDDALELLPDALTGYDRAASEAGSGLPALRVVLSGTGPRRARWAPRLEALGLGRVEVETPFLPADDYPALLASAHLGLSLHRSASGVDLPMKVVEMHGAGLPVLALDYGPCLEELVTPGRDALLFRDADGLAAALREALAGFPDAPLLERLRDGVADAEGGPWHEAWRETALPLLTPSG